MPARKNNSNNQISLENIFFTLFDKISVSLIILNESGNIIKVNKPFSSLLKNDPIDFMDKNINEFIHISDREFFLERYQDFFNNPDGEFIELRLLGKNNRNINVRLQASRITELIFDNKNNSDLLLVTITNLDQLKKLRTDLSKTELMFESMFENSGEAILIADRTANFTEANLAALKLLEISREEILTLSLPDIVSDLSTDDCLQLWFDFTSEGKMDEVFKIKDKKGKLKIVRVVGSAHFLPNTHMLLLTDITEKRINLENIRKLSAAVEQSPSSIVITDIEGNIEYANKKFSELTGYGFDEVKGKNPRILNSRLLPQELFEELWEVITSGREWRGEFLNKKKNGELFWEDASITSIKDNNGKILNYLKVAEDITERKNFERRLQKSEENYKATLDNMLIGVVVHAADTSIILSNPRASEILGLTAAQMAGKKAINQSWNFVNPDGTTMPPEKYPVNQVIKNLNPIENLILGVQHPDKDCLNWIKVNATPIFDEKNDLEKIIINFEELAER